MHFQKQKGDKSQMEERISHAPQNCIIPVKNSGNEDVALFSLLLPLCKQTVLTELSSITHKARHSFLAVKDIQTIWMSNAGLDFLNLSSKIKPADYDHAGGVVRT